MHDSGDPSSDGAPGSQPIWDHRAAGFGIALLALLFGATLGGSILFERALDDIGVSVLVSTSVLQLGMLGIAVRLGPGSLARFDPLLGVRRLATLPLFGWAAMTLLVIVLANAVFLQIAGAVSDRLVPPALPEAVDVDRLKWLTFVSVVLAGPFVEEVFFRGFLFAGLMRGLGLWPAVALSSAVFAATHVDVALLGPAFIAGVAFALVAHRTGSVWPAILAHTSQNAIAFGLAA